MTFGMFGPLGNGQPAGNSMMGSPQSFYGAANNAAALPGMDYGSLGSYGTNVDPTMAGGANPGMFQNISQGLGAFTSLAQIYGMFQNLGLQKRAFKFAQEGTKRNFNAQATAYNEAVASKETARHAAAARNGQDYNSMYAYGTGQKVDKWS